MLSRFIGALFGERKPDSGQDARLVADAVAAIVEAVDPRLALVPRHEQKLEPATLAAIASMRQMGRDLPEPIELSAAAWSTDPRVHAFFPTVDALKDVLARSDALHEFFADPASASAGEAHAFLGMTREDRNVLGAGLIDGTVRQDVARKTIGFTAHRLIAPAATPAESRVKVGMMVFQRLAEIALSRILEKRGRADQLEQTRAMLETQLRMLKSRRSGIAAALGEGGSDADAAIASIEAKVAAARTEIADVRGSMATFEGYFEPIVDVLANVGDHVKLHRSKLSLDQLGFVADSASSGPVSTIEVPEIEVGDVRRAFAFVRCARSEVPPKPDLLSAALKALG